MAYGHADNLANLPNGKPPKSAFVTYTLVIYTTHDERRLYGQVVGPDQDYFPSPSSVFVSFPSTGFTKFLYVTDLELAPPKVE